MSDDSNRIDVTRRQLLRGAAAVAAATGATGALANCTGGGGGGLVDAGAVSVYNVGTYRSVQTVIVGRDANGIYAYSNICTHEACAVPPPASETANSQCPCHMSTYNSNGEVQAGSLATRNLAHYAVMINSGNVMVDTSMSVPASTRTPPA